jgi:signal transduction histidine kinase
MTHRLGKPDFESTYGGDSVATGRLGDLRGSIGGSQPSLLECAMQQVVDGVAVAKSGDAGGLPMLVYYNRSFSLMADFPSHAIPENPRTLLAASRANSPLLSCLADALTDHALLAGEITLGDAAGKRRQIDWRATQLRDSAGSITHTIAVYRDITIQRQSEESLSRLERLASLGAMTAAIVHEVNNPLGAATLAADTALAAADSPHQENILSVSLSTVVQSLDRCGQIVKTLLRFVRDEPNDKIPSDLKRIVTRSRDLVRNCAERQGACVELDLAEDLPPICATPLEIEIAIVNLLLNAIQAGRPGVRVLIRTRPSGDRVRLSVEDDGLGMTEHERQHAFEPLFSMRRGDGGTGLGLYVVSRMVSAQGGTIMLQSRRGKGTVVTIELPVATGPTASTAAERCKLANPVRQRFISEQGHYR